jgi:hypothetical protein
MDQSKVSFVDKNRVVSNCASVLVFFPREVRFHWFLLLFPRAKNKKSENKKSKNQKIKKSQKETQIDVEKIENVNKISFFTEKEKKQRTERGIT